MVVHGYTGTAKKITAHESAAMISKALNKFFVEEQISTISGIGKYGQGIGGSRQLMTIEYDGKYASPFIQYQQLRFDNEYNHHGAYVGLDTDVLSFNNGRAMIDQKY